MIKSAEVVLKVCLVEPLKDERHRAVSFIEGHSDAFLRSIPQLLLTYYRNTSEVMRVVVFQQWLIVEQQYLMMVSSDELPFLVS